MVYFMNWEEHDQQIKDYYVNEVKRDYLLSMDVLVRGVNENNLVGDYSNVRVMDYIDVVTLCIEDIEITIRVHIVTNDDSIAIWD